MRWLRDATGKFDLVVAPLHGRGNRNGEGAGVKILAYTAPANPRDTWKTDLINDSLHMTHNFELVKWARPEATELLVAGKEGIFHFVGDSKGWKSWQLVGRRPEDSSFAGCGEVRAGNASSKALNHFIATIEPMHGNQVSVYVAPSVDAVSGLWNRKVIDSSLREGHALACGDLLGIGRDQIVAGWR